MDIVDLTSTALRITQGAMEKCQDALQHAGRHGVECLLLVAGQVSDGALLLDHVYLPRQRATAVSVRLLPDSLIPIHQDLAEKGRIIALQMHTHPGSAYHTGTDDADTTVTQEGSVSVVVPNYAADGLANWPGCIAYVLGPDGWSEALHPDQVLEVVA